MTNSSLGQGAEAQRWFRWADSTQGRAIWAQWCVSEANGLEGQLAQIGCPGGERCPAMDERILCSLVAWARSGEPMAMLALEAEMASSLCQFVRLWSRGFDTSKGADGWAPKSCRSEAVGDWVVGQFAIVVLTIETEHTMRSALHGRLRSKLFRLSSRKSEQVHSQTVPASDSVVLDRSFIDNDVDGLMSARRQLSVAASQLAGTAESAALVAELAERVWLRDEPIEAAAAAAGLSHAAARQRLCRLAAFGRERPELFGVGSSEVFA